MKSSDNVLEYLNKLAAELPASMYGTRYRVMKEQKDALDGRVKALAAEYAAFLCVCDPAVAAE